MCVGSFKFHKRESRYWAYGLMSLSEKMRRSNHLQILGQRWHLLNYFKALSVGPAGNRTQTSHRVDWCLTNYANQTVAIQLHFWSILLTYFEFGLNSYKNKVCNITKLQGCVQGCSLVWVEFQVISSYLKHFKVWYMNNIRYSGWCG